MQYAIFVFWPSSSSFSYCWPRSNFCCRFHDCFGLVVVVAGGASGAGGACGAGGAHF